MLPKTKKQKGKRFEKYVAKELKKVLGFVYARADSGSGKEHKEDITLPDYVGIYIECKNHAKKDLKRWWSQTVEGCPDSKIPILVYRLNYQKEPTVVMSAIDFLDFLSGEWRNRIVSFREKWELYPELSFLVEFGFNSFLELLKMNIDKLKWKIV